MLGETLRIIRISNDKKITEVSLETGISKSYLTEIEKNIKNPSYEILEKLCANYNIPYNALITLNEYSEEASLNFQQTLLMILKYYEFQNIKNDSTNLKHR